VFSLNGNNPRSNVNTNIGFRSAMTAMDAEKEKAPTVRRIDFNTG
jgi:thiamine biosynthesis protein ThiC